MEEASSSSKRKTKGASLSQILGLGGSWRDGNVNGTADDIWDGSGSRVGSIDPDDYPFLVPLVLERLEEYSGKGKGKARDKDLRSYYIDRLEGEDETERKEDDEFLSRAKEFVELHDQIDASTGLLLSLETFLSTFQSELSNVSGQIAELQDRSRGIDARLQGRKALDRFLNPYLSSILIPPSMINLILDTEVGDNWIPAIRELEARLSAIRSGPRVKERKALDDVAEGLRIKASEKLRSFFISLLTPFRTSLAPSLSQLQQSQLLKYRPLFAFLQRHSPRVAHEVQKVYMGTVRWYWETGFRRYCRALERIRVKSLSEFGSLEVSDSESQNGTGNGTREGLDRRSRYATVEGEPAIPAHLADDPKFATPEALFRSVSIVLLENASAEYHFISSFFNRPPEPTITPPTPFNNGNDLSSSLSSLTTSSASSAASASVPNSVPPTPPADKSSNVSPSPTPPRQLVRSSTQTTASTSNSGQNGANNLPKNDESSAKTPRASEHNARHPVDDDNETETNSNMGAEADGESVMGSEYTGWTIGGSIGGAGIEGKEEKMKRSLVDNIWKQVFDPALAYIKSFQSALLNTSSPPNPLSLLTMIRLNDRISALCLSSPSPLCPTPQLETHLSGLRLQLWPIFQKEMGKIVDATGRLVAGANGGKVKDSAVQASAKRFVVLFKEFVSLSETNDEEMVFTGLLRYRTELHRLIIAQANRMRDPAKGRAYLSTNYEEILHSLVAGPSSHPKSQAEVAHWRELLRKV